MKSIFCFRAAVAVEGASIGLYNILRGLPLKLITHAVGPIDSASIAAFLAGGHAWQLIKKSGKSSRKIPYFGSSSGMNLGSGGPKNYDLEEIVITSNGVDYDMQTLRLCCPATVPDGFSARTKPMGPADTGVIVGPDSFCEFPECGAFYHGPVSGLPRTAIVIHTPGSTKDNFTGYAAVIDEATQIIHIVRHNGQSLSDLGTILNSQPLSDVPPNSWLAIFAV